MRAEVADSAYRLYEKRGSRDGQDVQNWLEAESQVMAKHTADKHAHHQSTASGSASSR